MSTEPYHYDNSEAMRDMSASDWTSIAEPHEPLPPLWRLPDGYRLGVTHEDAVHDEALADLAHGMWDQDEAAESYHTQRRHEDEGLDR